jgi:hypothetical protein
MVPSQPLVLLPQNFNASKDEYVNAVQKVVYEYSDSQKCNGDVDGSEDCNEGKNGEDYSVETADNQSVSRHWQEKCINQGEGDCSESEPTYEKSEGSRPFETLATTKKPNVHRMAAELSPDRLSPSGANTIERALFEYPTKSIIIQRIYTRWVTSSFAN